MEGIVGCPLEGYVPLQDMSLRAIYVEVPGSGVWLPEPLDVGFVNLADVNIDSVLGEVLFANVVLTFPNDSVSVGPIGSFFVEDPWDAVVSLTCGPSHYDNVSVTEEESSWSDGAARSTDEEYTRAA